MINFFRKLKNWIIGLIIGGVCLAAVDLTTNDISVDKLKAKYDVSELKDKYILDGASLKKSNNNPKDKIDIQIGNASDTEFIPSLKISRWEEVNFSIKPKGLDKIATKNKALKLEGDKVKFETPDIDYHLYEMGISAENPENAFEFEVILKKKPKTNIVEFEIQSEGLDFFHQPKLTQEEIDDGANRPENVVGSYAVYAKTPKTNWTGGKEYKCGKIGHIYRPKIIDSAGKETWGILNIDKEILSVEIPQEFLDNAVYPVRHAAGLTFGVTTEGASQGVWGLNYWRGEKGTPTSNGSVNSISAYFGVASGSFKGTVVGNSLTIVTDGVATGILITSTDWTVSSFETLPSITGGNNYWASGIIDNALAEIYYDAVTANGTHARDATNSYTTPTNPTDADINRTTKCSIYATYTAAGGAAAPAPQIIIIE